MGCNEPDVIGKKMSRFFPAEYGPIIDEAVERTLSGEHTSFEAAQIRQDGSIVLWRAVLSPILDATRNVSRFVGIFEDITERKRAEEDHLRTQKLESIGILAGGIAHDFNNLFTAVFGYISLAKLKADARIVMHLEKAEKALDHARSLSQQLLTFSKGGDPVKKIIDLGPLIYETVQFAMSGSNVNVVFSVPEDLRMVEADPGQFAQVMNNIIINAVEAMPSGGTIKVIAGNETFKADTNSSKAGDYVAISITDDGVGIPEEYLSKIFDPFFTTKTKGNGIGLSSTYSIIKKHGGMLEVKSEVGKGSTFTIFLPVSKKVAIDKGPEDKGLVYGNRKILVLEDEEFVAHVCAEMMNTLGYDARFVTTGDKILQEYIGAVKCGNPYDAVILDLTIKGGMGGEKTMEGLRVIDPHVNAIVSSGYADDPIIANYSLHGFKAVLAKPYRIEEVSKTLNEVFKNK